MLTNPGLYVVFAWQADVMWLDVDTSDPKYENLYASHRQWVDNIEREMAAEQRRLSGHRNLPQHKLPQASQPQLAEEHGATPAGEGRARCYSTTI